MHKKGLRESFTEAYFIFAVQIFCDTEEACVRYGAML